MRTVDLHFPKEGVSRRMAERQTSKRGTYPCPWAVNVRVDDNIDRRMRGGSRPGLTNTSALPWGTTIDDAVSIRVSRGGAESEVLMVLVDSEIKTIADGVITDLVGYMAPDDNEDDVLTNDAGTNLLLASEDDPPSSGFLVPGKQKVFAVGTSEIAMMSPVTGQSENLQPSGGSIPSGSTFGALYRDRLILSGGSNAIYASRQGDHANWDFGAQVDRMGRAIIFQLSEGGLIGPQPTALIPHQDQTLLIASSREIWVLNGDPASGTLRRVSENIGIISSRAWCKADNTIYFLSETGVYRIGVNGSDLSPVSERDVPIELRDIDTSTVTPLLSYDHDRRSVHIFLPTDSLGDTHWTYEIEAEAFWPVRFLDDHSPLAVVNVNGIVHLAGVDGYIREFRGDDDDGTDIQSHVLIGPFRLGKIDTNGIINKVRGMLATGSGTVTWRIVTGDYAEEASDNGKLAIERFQNSDATWADLVKQSDTWTAGRSNSQYPRVQATWACMWLQSTDKWGIEGATMELKQAGRIR